MRSAKSYFLGIILFLSFLTPSFAATPKAGFTSRCQQLLTRFRDMFRSSKAPDKSFDQAVVDVRYRRGKHEKVATLDLREVAYKLPKTEPARSRAKERLDVLLQGTDRPSSSEWVYRTLKRPLRDGYSINRIRNKDVPIGLGFVLNGKDGQPAVFSAQSIVLRFKDGTPDSVKNDLIRKHGMEVVGTLFPKDNPVLIVSPTPSEMDFSFELLSVIGSWKEIDWVEPEVFEQIGPRSEDVPQAPKPKAYLVYVNIEANPNALDEVVARLKTQGIEVTGELRGIGALVVKYDPSKIEDLKSTEGISEVYDGEQEIGLVQPVQDKPTLK